jgi:hypothetical protein
MSGDPSDRPPPEGPRGAGGPESSDDPLDALRNRIRSTQDAVERLAGEAADAAREAAEVSPEPEARAPRADEPGRRERQSGRPPRNGYAVPGGSSEQTTRELQALVALIDVFRGLIPRELAVQLTELVRELLLLVRALIDWYVERLELRRRTPVEVEDIPIS